MLSEIQASEIVDQIDEEKLLDLAKSMVRIASPRLHESELADWVAAYLAEAGFEVEIQKIAEGEIQSKNVIGRIRGNGEGSNLLLLGHMDVAAAGFTPPHSDLWTKDPLEPELEEGWLYGWGAGNMKSGDAAMIIAANAVLDSKLALSGDLTVACVMGETYGSMGTLQLLKLINSGDLKADIAIVPERTQLDIVTITVGNAKARIEVEGKMRFRANGESSPIDQMVKLLSAMGPSYRLNPVLESWLSFEPHPELPGYPQVVVERIESQGDVCAINFWIRFVPGQSPASIEADLAKLIDKLHAEDPTFKATLMMPPSPKMVNNEIPHEIPHDDLVVVTTAKWHEYVTGSKPIIGGGHRLGSPADAAPLMLSGVRAITYGPGVTSIEQDPPDERIPISEVIAAAKVLALTAADICSQS